MSSFQTPPPGQQPPTAFHQPQGPHVPDYTAMSIIATVFGGLGIFCCVTLPLLPGAIVALVHALQVNNKKLRGDFQGALHSASIAKKALWISLIVEVVLIVLAIVVFVLIAIFAEDTSSTSTYSSPYSS